jgi:hypothetical protein
MNKNGPPKDKRPPLPNGPGHGRTKGAKSRLTRERVEKELRVIALMNARALFGTGKKKYTLRDIADMPEEMQRCIASVKVRTENLSAGDDQQDQTVEVRLWPKVQALELCARSLGMLKDHVVIEGLDDRKARLRAALTRGDE